MKSSWTLNICAALVFAHGARTAAESGDNVPTSPPSVTFRWLKSCSSGDDASLFEIEISKNGSVAFLGGPATKIIGRTVTTIDEQNANVLFARAQMFLRRSASAIYAPQYAKTKSTKYCVEFALKDERDRKIKRGSNDQKDVKALLKIVNETIQPLQWVCPARDVDRPLNNSALAKFHCADYQREWIVLLHLRIPDWCNGAEEVEIFPDGTIHHYAYRNSSGEETAYVLEDFQRLSGEELSELSGVLRKMPLQAVDQNIGESMSGVVVSPLSHSGGVGEAEVARSWLTKKSSMKWLSTSGAEAGCDRQRPPSSVIVRDSFDSSPGMAVTAEVKIETRKLIEFVLSPVMAHLDESGRER